MQRDTPCRRLHLSRSRERSGGGRSATRVPSMGEEVAARVFTREDRQRYRKKVHRCLDVLERMLAENRFDFDRPMTGMEIELNLVDDVGDPSMTNTEILALIDDPAFQAERGRFNPQLHV